LWNLASLQLSYCAILHNNLASSAF
jgi:hypothetical protein